MKQKTKENIRQILTMLLVLITFSGYSQTKSTIQVALAKNTIAPKFLKEQLEEAISTNPTSARTWYLKAVFSILEKKKYEVALLNINKAVELNSNEYLNYRAYIKCIFLKRYSESLIDFCLLDNDKFSEIKGRSNYFFKSLCYLQLDSLEQAFLSIEKCIASEKKLKSSEKANYLYSYYKGIILYEQKNYEEALESFNTSLSSYSNFSDAEYYKGKTLEILGQTNNANLLFKNAFENHKKGYTINEPDALYEQFPYQITKREFEDKSLRQ